MKRKLWRGSIKVAQVVNIKEVRLQQGLTQAQVAERMEISPEHYAMIERGQHGCQIETLVRLAHALELALNISLE